MNSTARIADLLAPHRGVIAVIGTGGKSTLLTQAGRALARRGARVALATTTHMLPPEGIRLVSTAGELDHTLGREGVAAIGELDRASGKVGAPHCGVERLTDHADYVLIEADGSKRLPLKAHTAWEPVVPEGTVLTVLVVGASGFGERIGVAVHRPEVFCHLTGATPADPADGELVARAVVAERLVGAHDLVIVNQVDNEDAAQQARAFARALNERIAVPVFAGSLRADTLNRV